MDTSCPGLSFYRLFLLETSHKYPNLKVIEACGICFISVPANKESL